jgi:lambda family phage portal protein
MIFDNLLPGEKPELIGSDRPNSGLGDFRDSMLRACAAGTSTNASSISRNYDGSYSAQRQEMVEGRPAYQRMANYFIDIQMLPIWRNFVDMSITAGLVSIPANIDKASLYNPHIRGPGMPWIDPKKEMEADVLAVDNAFKSRQQVIRERGGDPVQVDKERAMDTAAPVKDDAAKPVKTTSEQDDAQAAIEAAA